METPTVEELNSWLKKDQIEPEEVPDWSQICKVRKSIDPNGWKDLENAPICGKEAVVRVTMVCPFCGPLTYYYCEAHKLKALQGEIVCKKCSLKARNWIYMRPASAIWKQD